MATAELLENEIVITCIDIPQKQKESLTKTGTADLKKQIGIIIRDTQKGKSPSEISKKYGLDYQMTEKIVRLYLTHPGVDVTGILQRIS